MSSISSSGTSGGRSAQTDAQLRLRRLLASELRAQQQNNTLTTDGMRSLLLQYLGPNDFAGSLAVLNELTQHTFSVHDLNEPNPLAFRQAGTAWGRLFAMLSTNFQVATQVADPAAMDMLHHPVTATLRPSSAAPAPLNLPVAASIARPRTPAPTPASAPTPRPSSLLDGQQERIAFVRDTLLLPDNPQGAAFEINNYLADNFGLQRVDIEKYLDADDAALKRAFPSCAPEVRFIVNLLNEVLGRTAPVTHSVHDNIDDLQQWGASDYEVALAMQSQEALWARAPGGSAALNGDDANAVWQAISDGFVASEDAWMDPDDADAADPTIASQADSRDEAIPRAPLAQAIASATGAPLAAPPTALLCPRSAGGPLVDPFTMANGVTVNRGALQPDERRSAVRDHSMRSLCDAWNSHCHNEAQAYEHVYQSLTCPISRCLMENPVLACDGMAYDLDSIEPMVGRVSPLTRQITLTDIFIPHKAMRALIESPQIQAVHLRREAQDAGLSAEASGSGTPAASRSAGQAATAQPSPNPLKLPPGLEQVVRPSDIAPALHAKFTSLGDKVSNIIREFNATMAIDDQFRINPRITLQLQAVVPEINALINSLAPKSYERRLALILRIEVLHCIPFKKSMQRQALLDLNELAQDGLASNIHHNLFELTRRGQVLCKLKRHSEARQLIGPSLASGEFSQSPRWMALVGELARKDHLFHLAEDMLNQAHAREPTSFSALSMAKTLTSMMWRRISSDDSAVAEQLAQFSNASAAHL